MENDNRTNYIEDRLPGMSRSEILGAEYYAKDLKRLAANATSLKDCYDIHKAAVDLGIYNKNLDADPEGYFRCSDIHNLSKEDIYLGGQYGVYTKSLTVFEGVRDTRPDAYMQALSQYKNLLTSNFEDIREKAFFNEMEETKENSRNIIARLVSPGKHSPRKTEADEYPPIAGYCNNFKDALISAKDSPVLSTEKINILLTNEAIKHNAVNRLLDKIDTVGRTSFRLEREAFDDWVPAITFEGSKYIVESVEKDGNALSFNAKAYDGKNIVVKVDGSNHGRISGTCTYAGGGSFLIKEQDAQQIKERLPYIASMTYVNLDWQDRMVENFRQTLPHREKDAETQIRGIDETKELAELDRLCEYYTAEQFKLLFPAVRLSDCNAVETKDGMDLHLYGGEKSETRFVRACPQDTVTDAYWRSEVTGNYGTHPSGNELLFDRNGTVTEFRTNLTPQYSHKTFTSDSIFFRQDGGIDKEKTVAARGKGDYPISFCEILENIDFILQERQKNQVSLVMKTKAGFIGKDQDGFVLLDKKKNDLLNGMRFDVLTAPVNGISIGKVDGQYTLVNVNKGEMVDRVMRPYIGEMTSDGWALVREMKNGVERYNYINATGEMMSQRGFDYATEFREGKASVMVGKQFCELNSSGIVTSVEVTDTTAVKENKTVQIKM